MTDCAAISIIFDGAVAMARAAEAMLARASTFKNRIKKPTEEGYRDLMFTARLTGGHVCEVQLHLKDMMAAKKSGAGHRMCTVRGTSNPAPVPRRALVNHCWRLARHRQGLPARAREPDCQD